jgi:serine/threonine protein kinase
VTDMDGFFDEARITVGLQQHPNVVQTFGVSLDGQLPCIVLEFCEGGSLDNRLFDSDVTMTQQQKVELVKGVARGLYHLHTNNIVHRDLAARNVLLNKSGTPKISDFGMSRVLKSEAEKGKTKTNYGPIRWMAPESLRELQYSTKSDVWSFGIVLFEIVSRSEPHIDIDPLEVAVKIKNDSYHPSIPQNVDPVLREIMLSCWQPDPNNRPSMEQICNKLNTSFPDE